MNPAIQPAGRMSHVRYAIRDVLVEAEKVRAQGVPLTLLNIGDPAAVGGFRAPQHLVEAVRKAWADHRYEYAPSNGIPEAREAVAADWNRRGRPVHPDDVMITAGLSEAIRFLLTALVDPGEEVLLPAPGYPLYRAILGELGGVARDYELDEDGGWALRVSELESHWRPTTRALVIISPGNPTGHVLSTSELQGAVEFCRRHRLLLICDEVYDRLAFEGPVPVPSAATWAGDDVPVITLNGLSKNWLLPGARVGWAVFHNPHRMPAYIEAVRKLANARLCAPAPQQWAVRPALEGPQDHLGPFRAALREGAWAVEAAVERLPGVTLVPPEAAFYALPRLDLDHPAFQGYRTDAEVVLAWLRKTGVLTVPGSGFGQRAGTHHFRVVTLAGADVLLRAVGSLRQVQDAGEEDPIVLPSP